MAVKTLFVVKILKTLQKPTHVNFESIYFISPAFFLFGSAAKINHTNK